MNDWASISKSSIPDNYPELMADVQRQVGRCILMSQRIERIMKLLLADHETAFTLSQRLVDPVAHFQSRLSKWERMPLGQVVESFFRLYLLPDSDQGMSEHGSEVESAVRVKVSVLMPDIVRDRLRKEIEETVHARNDLAHHLIAKFTLDDLDGRRDALAFLEKSLLKLIHLHESLCSFAKSHAETKAEMASIINSPEFFKLQLDGNSPDWTGEATRQ